MRYRLLTANAVLLLALVGSHMGRQIENAEIDHKNFLGQLQLQFRGWKATDIEIPKRDLDLLEPDATIVRRFDGKSEGSAELVVIAGHRKKTVHTPNSCMTSEGWETLKSEPYSLQLPGQSVDGTRALMTHQTGRMVTLYFFTDGEDSTGSLGRFQLMQILKRLKARIPIGALVRIRVPFAGPSDPAEKLAEDFAREVLPPVLKSLREARLSV